MTFDKKEFLDMAQGRRKEVAASMAPEAMGLQKSAVDAEKLMDDPGWAVLQTVVQAAIEQADEVAEIYRQKLQSNDVVGHEVLIKTKIGLAVCNERIHVLKEVLAIPSDIVNSGEQAKSLLERIGALKMETEKAGFFSKN